MKRKKTQIDIKLLKQWNYSENKKIDPCDVSSGSKKIVSWKCGKGPDHEWEAAICDRTAGRNCPFCAGRRVSITNNLTHVAPNLTEEWHTIKNNKKPQKVYAGGTKKYWWRCQKGKDHEWEASISKRLAGRGCPVCRGLKVVSSNSLHTLLPEISGLWHPTKNENLTSHDVTINSHKKVWWRCEKGHEWKARVADRSRTKGCPFCAGKRVDKSNCLEKINPELAEQWHPTKNGKLTPDSVTPGSNKFVWWQCDRAADHEWQAQVVKRNAGGGCPFCRGLKVAMSNCLATTHPRIAAQWHRTKNPNESPYTVTSGSDKKIWWQCENDHEWKASISSRKRGRGCPDCVNQHNSLPVRKIISFLKQQSIFFEREKRFPDLRSKKNRPLAFDFYLPNLKVLIEYDGEFHSKAFSNRGGEEACQGIKARDEFKNKWADSNGYKLIRIDFRQKDQIENILERELLLANSIK